ncbi:hypothetical protein Hdeb2414_s0003g00092401 [Helianthus debilis subsp. tardiflorus]
MASGISNTTKANNQIYSYGNGPIKLSRLCSSSSLTFPKKSTLNFSFCAQPFLCTPGSPTRK